MKCEILSQGKYVNQTFRLIYEVQNRIYIGVTKKREKNCYRCIDMYVDSIQRNK